MVKCASCGKELDKDKAIFKKGKFFGTKKCLDKFEKEGKLNKKGDKNVCEFC